MPPSESLSSRQHAAESEPLSRLPAGWSVRAKRLLLDRLGMFSTVISSFSVFGLQALHAILLARLLGPAGRGEYGTAMFYAQTMLYIGLAGSLYSLARRASQVSANASPAQSAGDATDERWNLFAPLHRAALRVGSLTGCISMLIAMSLSIFALPTDKQYLLPFCLACAMMLPLEHIRLTALAVDHGRGEFRRYNIARIFAAAAFPMLTLILYVFQIRSLAVISMVTVMIPAIGYAFYYFVLTDCQQLIGPSEPKAAALLSDGLPDGLAVLASDVFDRLGIFLVLWMVTLEEQGFYVTALPAASLLVVAPHAFALFAFNAASNEQVSLTPRRLLQSSALVVIMQACAAMALLVVLAPLLLILYGAEFDGIIPVANVLVVAMAINGCGIVGDGYLRGRGRGGLGVYTRIAGAVAMLLAIMFLRIDSTLILVAVAACVGYGVNTLLTGGLCLMESQRCGVSETLSPTAAGSHGDG